MLHSPYPSLNTVYVFRLLVSCIVIGILLAAINHKYTVWASQATRGLGGVVTLKSPSLFPHLFSGAK